MPGTIKLIAADLDGTLLDSKSRVTRATAEAILAAQRKGIVFVPCTGRFPENAALVMLEAGIECPVICLNGAVIDLAPLGERMFEKFMDRDAAAEILYALETLGEKYFIFGKNSVFSRSDMHRHHSEVDFERRKELKSRIRYSYGKDACFEALKEPLYKFYVHFTKESSNPEAIRAMLGGIPRVALTQSSNNSVELMPDEVNKGSALKMLADHFGIPAGQVMALGDQMNDLPMIRYAGLSVAMGNAVEPVKQAADFITATNDEDGVARAIRLFCLDEASASSMEE